MISIYEDFVKDYNNPNITGEDIRRLNHLNAHQYSKLRAKALDNGDISTPRHMNTTGAKFYTKTKRGDFIVKKQYGNKTVLVGRFPDQATAEMIVSLCKRVNWDLKQISSVIDENKVKPKNYTYVNGYYIVEKRINGKRIVFYRGKHEAEAIHLVNELRKNDWDKSKVNLILDEMSLN
ncbi:MAG: hypothetical protein IJH12_01925 [Clostridia bacterium]|nr:hypothetical protein [Clostridia bacterium]